MKQLPCDMADQMLEIVVAAIACSRKSVYEQRTVHNASTNDTLLTDEQAEAWLQAEWARQRAPKD